MFMPCLHEGLSILMENLLENHWADAFILAENAPSQRIFG